MRMAKMVLEDQCGRRGKRDATQFLPAAPKIDVALLSMLAIEAFQWMYGLLFILYSYVIRLLFIQLSPLLYQQSGATK